VLFLVCACGERVYVILSCSSRHHVLFFLVVLFVCFFFLFLGRDIEIKILYLMDGWLFGLVAITATAAWVHRGVEACKETPLRSVSAQLNSLPSSRVVQAEALALPRPPPPRPHSSPRSAHGSAYVQYATAIVLTPHYTSRAKLARLLIRSAILLSSIRNERKKERIWLGKKTRIRSRGGAQGSVYGRANTNKRDNEASQKASSEEVCAATLMPLEFLPHLYNNNKSRIDACAREICAEA
jgi:hypothetical protein